MLTSQGQSEDFNPIRCISERESILFNSAEGKWENILLVLHLWRCISASYTGHFVSRLQERRHLIWAEETWASRNKETALAGLLPTCMLYMQYTGWHTQTHTLCKLPLQLRRSRRIVESKSRCNMRLPLIATTLPLLALINATH